jgi:hypothetical protein
MVGMFYKFSKKIMDKYGWKFVEISKKIFEKYGYKFFQNFQKDP